MSDSAPVPQRPIFPTNRKSVADIQREILETGSCRVYGFGTFTTYVEDAKTIFNYHKGIYEHHPERVHIQFKMDYQMRTRLNPEWYGDERDLKNKSVNHYRPPKQLGV